MTFTRLTLGEPRLRGRPKGGPVEEPCEEPLTYGANILQDPGFETSPSAPNGQTGEDFPARGSGSFPTGVWEDGSFASEVPDSVYWTILQHGLLDSPFSTGVERLPHLSGSDPHSGSQCVLTTDQDGWIEDNYLIPITLRLCELAHPTRTDENFIANRVEPGDFIEMSQWIKADNTTDGPISELFIWFLDDAWNFTGDDVDQQAITTSYAEHSFSTIAPASSHYFFAEYGWFNTSAGSVTNTIRQDDMGLEVQP